MANALYRKYKGFVLAGTLDYDANTIKAYVYDHATDAPVIDTDDFVDDHTGTKSTNRTAAFGSKTTTDGVADAADTSITALNNGVTFESVQVYNDTGGADSTNHLMVNIDTATGLPVTGNGGDLNIVWASTGLGAGGTAPGIYEL